MTRRQGPTIDNLLADSLIRAVMRADHVEPEALKSLMDGAAARIAAGRETGRGVMFVKSAFGRPGAFEARSIDGRAGEQRALGGVGRAAFCRGRADGRLLHSTAD